MRLLLPLKPAQGPQLPAGLWMDRLGATFEPPDVQTAMGEVDGVPAQRDELGRPQPVPVGDQHHGGIAVAIAILPASIDQAGNLAIGEVLAGADLGVTFAARRAPAIANCPNNGGWRTSVRCGFVMIFQGSSGATVPNMTSLGTLHKPINPDFMGTTAISGAATRTGQHAGDAELAGIFCRWATDATARMASKGRQCTRTATHRRDFF